MPIITWKNIGGSGQNFNYGMNQGADTFMRGLERLQKVGTDYNDHLEDNQNALRDSNTRDAVLGITSLQDMQAHEAMRDQMNVNALFDKYQGLIDPTKVIEAYQQQPTTLRNNQTAVWNHEQAQRTAALAPELHAQKVHEAAQKGIIRKHQSLFDNQSALIKSFTKQDQFDGYDYSALSDLPENERNALATQLGDLLDRQHKDWLGREKTRGDISKTKEEDEKLAQREALMREFGNMFRNQGGTWSMKQIGDYKTSGARNNQAYNLLTQDVIDQVYSLASQSAGVGTTGDVFTRDSTAGSTYDAFTNYGKTFGETLQPEFDRRFSSALAADNGGKGNHYSPAMAELYKSNSIPEQELQPTLWENVPEKERRYTQDLSGVISHIRQRMENGGYANPSTDMIAKIFTDTGTKNGWLFLKDGTTKSTLNAVIDQVIGQLDTNKADSEGYFRIKREEETLRDNTLSEAEKLLQSYQTQITYNDRKRFTGVLTGDEERVDFDAGRNAIEDVLFGYTGGSNPTASLVQQLKAATQKNADYAAGKIAIDGLVPEHTIPEPVTQPTKVIRVPTNNSQGNSYATPVPEGQEEVLDAARKTAGAKSKEKIGEYFNNAARRADTRQLQKLEEKLAMWRKDENWVRQNQKKVNDLVDEVIALRQKLGME